MILINIFSKFKMGKGERMKKWLINKLYYSKMFSELRGRCFREAYLQAIRDGRVDEYLLRRANKALQLACDVMESDMISPSEEHKFLVTYVITEDLPSYFIREAEKLLIEERYGR